MKIIVRNKRKFDEKQELTLEEFKIKFRNELQSAINIYTHHQQQKDMIKPPFMNLNTDYKADFYRDLKWNFNNNSLGIYYIDRIIY